MMKLRIHVYDDPRALFRYHWNIVNERGVYLENIIAIGLGSWKTKRAAIRNATKIAKALNVKVTVAAIKKKVK